MTLIKPFWIANSVNVLASVYLASLEIFICKVLLSYVLGLAVPVLKIIGETDENYNETVKKLLGKEKRMVTVLKTAIICATIVAVVYLLMKSGDDKKDKDQKGEE